MNIVYCYTVLIFQYVNGICTTFNKVIVLMKHIFVLANKSVLFFCTIIHSVLTKSRNNQFQIDIQICKPEVEISKPSLYLLYLSFTVSINGRSVIPQIINADSIWLKHVSYKTIKLITKELSKGVVCIIKLNYIIPYIII